MHRIRAIPSSLLAMVGGSASAQVAAVTGPGAPYAGQKVVQVTVKDQREFVALSRLVESVWTHTPRVGPVEVQVTGGQLAALRQLNLPVEVMIDDLGGYVDAQMQEIAALRGQRGLSWYANYKTFAEINARAQELVAENPELSSLRTIGSSLNGNPIVAVSLTGPENERFPRATRPQVLFNGTQHAREWVSPMTVMYLLEQFLGTYSRDSRVTELLDRCELLVVPVVNPDGYLYTWSSQRMWRKNMRDNGDGTFGVDTNRNWAYQWGSDNGSSGFPGSETYRGTAPFSEPETQVLRDYFLANPRIVAHIDYHTHGNYVLEPWGYTNSPPPDAGPYDIIGRRVEAAIERVFLTAWREGQTYSTLYPVSGGVNDWVYAGTPTPYKALSYTLELRGDGGGFAPPPSSILPSALENWPGAIEFMQAIVLPLRFAWQGAQPEVAAPGLATPVSVRVEANPRHQLVSGSVLLHYRLAGTGVFHELPMADAGGGVFAAELPAVLCGRTLEYHFSAGADGGEREYFPAEGGARPFTVRAAQRTVRWTDPCESSSQWLTPLQGDNAVAAGRWAIGDPNPTPGQPGDDHSAGGTRCWTTGLSGSSTQPVDVDGGRTSISSQPFNLLAPEGVASLGSYLTFWRSITNNTSDGALDDVFNVHISVDLGETWSLIDSRVENTDGWQRTTYTIDDHVVPTSAMLVRFDVRDDGADSLVEAALDDFEAYVLWCSEYAADVNGDGFVNGIDFDTFVYAFQDGLPLAEFDGDGFVTQLDFDAFVWAYENP